MNNPYIPEWWAKAIAIEYLQCRDFSQGERISQFDFGMVTDEQLENAIKNHKIVAYGTIIHNLHPTSFKTRILLGLIGGVTSPIIDGEPDNSIPNGIVSQYHFPYHANPIDTVDPIETFNSHIQVLDDGVLYQWEIAKFEGVEGRHYGRWVSEYVDLSMLDEDRDEFQELMILKAHSNDNPNEYITRAKSYIENIQSMRLEIFNKLLDVHEELKNTVAKKSKTKTIEYSPPVLSNFETMQIKKNDIYTKASMAPIFYRSALKHRQTVKQLQNPNGEKSIHIIDEIHQEKAETIIMAATCLEAVINEIGDITFNEIWKELNKLPTQEKYKAFFRLCNKLEEYDASKPPFQFLNKLVSARNEMIHPKQKYRKVTVFDNSTSVSKLDTLLDMKLIDDLPEILFESISAVYEASETTPPRWLSDRPGWIVNHNEN